MYLFTLINHYLIIKSLIINLKKQLQCFIFKQQEIKKREDAIKIAIEQMK